MDYKLAKKLKDSGFPQKPNGIRFYRDGNTEFVLISEDSFEVSEEILYQPTLEELIEACKTDDFGDMADVLLFQSGNKWFASQWDGCYFGDLYIDGGLDDLTEGKTPTEAVAKLYLKLNKCLIK